MKNKIVTCLSNSHPLYDESFKRENVRVGKSYECVGELALTAENYYIPEFGSLQGITINSRVDNYGWSKPCFPTECFRLATTSEIKKYQVSIVLNAPFRFVKIWFFRIIRKVDHIVRKKYYDKMYKDIFV